MRTAITVMGIMALVMLMMTGYRYSSALGSLRTLHWTLEEVRVEDTRFQVRLIVENRSDLVLELESLEFGLYVGREFVGTYNREYFGQVLSPQSQAQTTHQWISNTYYRDKVQAAPSNAGWMVHGRAWVVPTGSRDPILVPFSVTLEGGS